MDVRTYFQVVDEIDSTMGSNPDHGREVSDSNQTQT